jgi:hypothetical protein
MNRPTRTLACFTVITATIALGGVAPQPVEAQSVAPQPEISLYYNNLTAVRYNPLGLVDFFDVSLRLRLFESESDVSAQNFVGLGVSGGISPAWARIGAIAFFQPLTILQLYAKYEIIGYFSSFDLFASFDSADADYSDTTIEARGANPTTANYSTFGRVPGRRPGRHRVLGRHLRRPPLHGGDAGALSAASVRKRRRLSCTDGVVC